MDEKLVVIQLIEDTIRDTDLKKYPYLSRSIDVLKKVVKELKERYND